MWEAMINYKIFDEVAEEYFRNHPEEVDDFISILFVEYIQGEDTDGFLSVLRIACRAKGVSFITENSGISQEEMQEILSEDGDPKFESVCRVLYVLGYWLAPQKLQTSETVMGEAR